jgi:hypothetical protein
MIAAMQTLKRYDTDVQNFTKCLEFEASQNRLTRDMQNQQQNAAVDRLKRVAEAFNVQVKVFKEKQHSSGG